MEVKKIIASKIKRLTFLLDAVTELEKDFGITVRTDTHPHTDKGTTTSRYKKRKTAKKSRRPKGKIVPYKKSDYKIMHQFVFDHLKQHPSETFTAKSVGKLLRKEGYKRMSNNAAGHILKSLRAQGKVLRTGWGKYELYK